MSIDATRWAWEQQVTPAQKLVLLSLADRANESHECYPSTKRLCHDTGLYRETIFEAIKAMEDLGLIIVERQLGKGNRFTLVGVQSRHQNNGETVTSRKKPTSQEKPTGSAKQPVGKSRLHQSGKADSHQSGKADTESINESIKNHISEISPFEEFWKAYPRKVSKDAAQKAWVKCKPPLQDVLQALAWQVRSEQWRQDNGAFIPYPATYLNKGRWKDEPPAVLATAPDVTREKPPRKVIPKDRLNKHITRMHNVLGGKAGKA